MLKKFLLVSGLRLCQKGGEVQDDRGPEPNHPHPECPGADPRHGQGIWRGLRQTLGAARFLNPPLWHLQKLNSD